LFGLPLFFEISLDGSEMVPKQKKICQNALLKIMKEPYAKSFVLSYLLKSLKQVKLNDSLITSINLSTTILSQFSSEASSYASDEDKELLLPNLLQILDKELQIKNTVLRAIETYHHTVKEIVKTMSDEGKKLPENPGKHVFLSTYSHEETLKSLLDFVAYIIVQSRSPQVAFGEEGIKMLWELFVQHPNFEVD
jgi:hypothetical protein